MVLLKHKEEKVKSTLFPKVDTIILNSKRHNRVEGAVTSRLIARLFFALSNNRTKIPHFKRLLSGGMSHRFFLFILDFILSMTLNSHVHADRHFRFQKCLLFVKLYIFLYLYSITLWTDQMHFPHNTFFPVRGLQPRLFWHPS